MPGTATNPPGYGSSLNKTHRPISLTVRSDFSRPQKVYLYNKLLYGKWAPIQRGCSQRDPNTRGPHSKACHDDHSSCGQKKRGGTLSITKSAELQLQTSQKASNSKAMRPFNGDQVGTGIWSIGGPKQSSMAQHDTLAEFQHFI